MLHEFLIENRDELVRRTRAKVAARMSPRVTHEELENGVPIFLEQLAEALRRSQSDSRPEIGKRAGAHGRDLLRMGFTVAQVVHDYGDVCQAVTELASEQNAPITNDEFHTFNGCLDDAIAQAVTEYAVQREQAITKVGTERLGILAHELRNLLATATLSFEIVRKGTVGTSGSTGAVLARALKGIRDLVDRSLATVRLEAGIHHRERIAVRDFLDDVETTASLEAQAAGHRLTVIPPTEPDLAVDADRAILASAVTNLLQNAYKFSHSHSHIVLHAHASNGFVLIDVEDECGGLPGGSAEELLFEPYERRSLDRTGLGLGLAISREGAVANGGALIVRDVPGRGCVFTLQLPRQSTSTP